MKDYKKTKAQLIEELVAIRQSDAEAHKRIIELNRLAVERQKAEIESNRMLMIEREQRTFVEARYEANATLYSTLQYDEVLDHILGQVGHITPHDAACIILLQGNTGHIFRWHGYAYFGAEKAISSFRFNVTDMPSLQMMQQTGRPVVVSHVDDQDAWRAKFSQNWIRSYVGTPIRIRDKVIGFLVIDSANPGFFGEVDADKLEAFVSQAVGALKNAWLYNQARREIVSRIKAFRKERNFVSAVFNITSALVIVLDPEKRIMRLNQACEQMIDCSIDEVKGRYIWDLFMVPDEVAMIKNIFDHLSAGDSPKEYESYWLAKDGTQHLISWTSTVFIDQEEAVEYIISTGFDITKHKQTEEALRQSEERYALAALAANDGLWDWDLKTNKIYFSGRWKAMLGYQQDGIGDNPDEWFSRVHPEDLSALKANIAAHLEAETTDLKSEYRMRHRNGDYHWMLTQWLAMWDKDCQAYRLIGSQTDITQRKIAEAKLRHASLHDDLTDLPNRALFMERMERAIEKAKADDGYLFAVLFLDLDRFKVINDSLGHLVGDQLLVTVADKLKSCLRSGDTVARLGGDEFAMLLENIQDSSEAVRTAEQAQSQLASPIYLAEHEMVTSASIGIALSSMGYEVPEDVLRDADTAMYRAKARGRTCYEIFDTNMYDQAMAVWELEAELRQAIERQEFEVYYQPFVSLVSGQITGVEALLRWRHPRRGLISSNEFISLAEETGLIIPLSEWVLRTACAQTQTWHEAGYSSLRVAVNVSFRQFQRGGEQQSLPELIADILTETGLAAQSLELEFAETSSITGSDLSVATLKELKALGLQIALDNFGIRSSLLSLKQFPIDTLKIDRSFVEDIVSNLDDAVIIKAIIAMAHDPKLRVVAEGVETETHLTWLQARQCDEMQGYLFSPPLPAEDMTQLLQQGAHLGRYEGNDYVTAKIVSHSMAS